MQGVKNDTKTHYVYSCSVNLAQIKKQWTGNVPTNGTPIGGQLYYLGVNSTFNSLRANALSGSATQGQYNWYMTVTSSSPISGASYSTFIYCTGSQEIYISRSAVGTTWMEAKNIVGSDKVMILAADWTIKWADVITAQSVTPTNTLRIGTNIGSTNDKWFVNHILCKTE